MAYRGVCLAGPTGCGKTAAALALAGLLDGVVVNFDSRQVYAGLEIVTAQPSPEELSLAEHRLYGFLAPDKALGAGEYTSLAKTEIEEIWRSGRTPILVGGTGLYLSALLHGLSPIPDVPAKIRQEVVERLERTGMAAMHEELTRLDPVFAAKVHPNDRQRLIRGIEVFEASGQPLSHWHGLSGDGLAGQADWLWIGQKLGLDELAPRLASRIDAMLALGALEEVARAFEKYPQARAQALSGIGCAEIISYLRGEASFEQAKALWIKRTRAYAKRQLTWFARVDELTWFRPEDTAGVLKLAGSFAA